jgi:tetratricopeptide (TPR) repeat protein
VAPDITADELDKEVLEELRSLPGDLADLVGRHLVAAERALEEDDPDRAHEHTKVARRFAARIGVVREAAGIVAYRAGHFSEALSDLRAARRLTGSEAYLPVMADCERGLGRPERAIDLVRSPEAERLDRAGRIELTIVESGARRDLGQHDAAVITLQRLPELRDPQPRPWSARLAFAYADALADAGHTDAATDWFGRAMAFDEDGETDAAERYAELTGAVIEDVEEEFDDEDDFDDAGVAESGEADEADADVDDSEALAEADDLLGDEPEPADEPEEAEAQGDEPEQAELRGDEPEEAEVRGDELQEAEARGNEPEAEAEPADVLDGTEPDEQSSDDSGSEPSGSGAAAQAETRGITPAFIEPNFGDTLDEDDEPTQNRPKSDD